MILVKKPNFPLSSLLCICDKGNLFHNTFN